MTKLKSNDDIKKHDKVYVKFDKESWCEEFDNKQIDSEYDVLIENEKPYLKIKGENLYNLDTFIRHSMIEVFVVN